MPDEPFVDPDPTTAQPAPEATDAAAWERLRALPSQDDAPVHWDARQGRFVDDPAPSGRGRSATGRPDPPPAPAAGAVPVVRVEGSPPPSHPTPPAPDPAATVAQARVDRLPPPDATAVLPAPPVPSAPAAPGAPPPPRPRPTTGRTAPGGGRGAPPPPPTRTGRGGGRPRLPGRRLARRIAIGVAVALVALVVLPLGFAWWQFSRLERVDVGDALSASGNGGTNYLIVGSDSREGISADDPNAAAIIGEEVTGQRADTIIVLRVGDGGARMLSIPRDLWVTNAETGEVGRINATYASGPDALIGTVEGLGIPVNRYLEINFVSFAGLVDAVGGITLELPHPARDLRSGLDVPEAGTVRLDGTQALAYVRSRAYEELVDGQWRTDPTGDLGRVQRQRQFLTALLGEVGRTRNPLALRSVATSLGPGLRIDDQMTFLDALRLAWDARGLAPESIDLPVVPRTTSGGAAVLELDEPDASAVIAELGGSG